MFVRDLFGSGYPAFQVQFPDNLGVLAFKIIEIQSAMSDSLRRWQKHIFASTNFSQKIVKYINDYLILYLYWYISNN